MSGVFSYAKAFDYDPVGNRLEQTTTVGGGADPAVVAKLRPGTLSSSYDERDRLLNEAGQSFGWDENGNLTTKAGEATYTWDDGDRLVGVTKADGSITTHVYDADGNRVQTTTVLPGQAAQVVNYLVDTSGGLSQVVAETNGAGVLAAYYVRGDGLLSVLRPDGASGFVARYFHADGMGSVRALTNEAGSVTDTYRYTAFGELLEHAGTDSQPYAFTGEPLDLSVGWQYHRARWMDPVTGRFVSRDPWRGAGGWSAHPFAYVSNQPGDLVDPRGLYDSPLGYAVQDWLCDEYSIDHEGGDVSCGRRMNYTAKVGSHTWSFIKPDIVDEASLSFLEVKPFSIGGISEASVQMAAYWMALAPAGYLPDILWQPEPNFRQFGPFLVSAINLGGVVYYTDAAAVAKELLVFAALGVTYAERARLVALLPQAAGALSEAAEVYRLAALASLGRGARLGQSVGLAIAASAIGGFAIL